MKFIVKHNPVPEQFNQLLTGITQYDGLYSNIKDQILHMLIQEQKGLCVYCNQQIVAGNATVEHFVCQSHNRGLELSYYNLFAVCEGNDGQIAMSHCDKYRANGAKNDYFFPFILFEHCKTTSWDRFNPFFDVAYNRRTGVYSGKIKARQNRINSYPSIETRINYAISALNLNAEILAKARILKWELVRIEQAESGKTWQELFDYYLNLDPQTNFHEFVLLAIRKQVP